MCMSYQNKTFKKREVYKAPECNIVDIQSGEKIMASSPEDVNATHEGFEEDDYEW